MSTVIEAQLKSQDTVAYKEVWPILQSNGLIAPYAERSVAALILPGDNQEENKQALAMVERVVQWKPYPLAPYRLSIWLMACGEDEKAFNTLKMAMTVYPNEVESFVAYLNRINAPTLEIPMRRLREKYDFLRKNINYAVKNSVY